MVAAADASSVIMTIASTPKLAAMILERDRRDVTIVGPKVTVSDDLWSMTLLCSPCLMALRLRDYRVTAAGADTDLALASRIFFTGQERTYLERFPETVLRQCEQRTIAEQQINMSTVTVALVGDSNDMPLY